MLPKHLLKSLSTRPVLVSKFRNENNILLCTCVYVYACMYGVDILRFHFVKVNLKDFDDILQLNTIKNDLYGIFKKL